MFYDLRVGEIVMGTRTIEFNCGVSKIQFDINERNILEILTPKKSPVTKNVEDIIINALKKPIGSKSLYELVRGKRNIVVVVDDYTRLTPIGKIVPVILEKFNDAGIDDSMVKIVVALGTHRPMTKNEVISKFGKEIAKRVEVINHEFRNPDALLDLGVTRNDTPIHVNKLVVEADFKIGVGNIVPHHISGFSGGAKIVVPGVSGEATIGAVHLLSTTTRRNYLGIVENIVRHEMENVARRINFNVIINVVLDPFGNVVDAVYGDLVKAHRTGIKISQQIYGIKTVDIKPDIVIANSYPAILDWWQAHKALFPADILVKEGGTIIVVAPCPEGVSKTHPELLEHTWKNVDEIVEMVRKGVIKDKVAASLLITWSKIRERAEVLLVSQGLSPDEAEKLGFRYFEDIEKALDYAFKKHGNNSKVSILTHAAETLPVGGKKVV